jgi:hypothetical protein
MCKSVDILGSVVLLNYQRPMTPNMPIRTVLVLLVDFQDGLPFVILQGTN